MEQNNKNQHIGNAGLPEDADDVASERSLIRLPDNDSHWMDEGTLRIQLSYKEAKLLAGKLVETPEIRTSIPSQLVLHDLLEAVLNNDQKLVDGGEGSAKLFDQLINTLVNHPSIDLICRKNARLAKEFSLAVEGPHIRYNIILARKMGFDDSAEGYESSYIEWLAEVTRLNIFTVECEKGWFDCAEQAGFNVSKLSKDFIEGFCSAIRTG